MNTLTHEIMPPVPNFEWYSTISKQAKQPPRCPIASAEFCPRYYASIWLLADSGFTTAIPEVEIKRLDKKWAPFKPTIAEEEPSLMQPGQAKMSIVEFCPEVAYDRFGAFASFLGCAGDEIDTQNRHETLSNEGAPRDDPRWRWSAFSERHFTQCREFSIFSANGPLKLAASSGNKRIPRKTLGPKLRWQVLARDAFTCVYCGRRPPEVALEVDHRRSVATGGSDDLENLCTSCQDCNRGKGAESAV